MKRRNIAQRSDEAEDTDTPPRPSRSAEGVSEQEIARRAYELYVQRGGGHGNHREDWLRAERELRAQAR